MLSPTNRKASDLIKMMERVGYLFVRSAGSHFYYRHSRKESVVVLPGNGSQIIPTAITASIFRNIINTGIATESEIEKAMSR